MVDDLLQAGGGERLAVEGIARLDPARFERWLCITRWSDDHERDPGARALVDRARDAGVELIRLRRRSKVSLLPWLTLLRQLRAHRVDVLHAHLFGSNVWASILGPLARVPVVVAHEHIWSYSGGGLRAALDKHLIGRSSAAFVAVSRAGARSMVEVEGVDPRKIAFVPNGIAPLGEGSGAAVRSELGISPEVPLVVSVGHLRPQKAFELAIEAISLLEAAGRPTHLLVAGEGPERARLEADVERLGVGELVHLPGARGDIADVLAAGDIALCCSHFEGGPLSVMEYMEAALPIVATRVAGLDELIEDRRTGLLAQAGDAAAIAAAMTTLIDDPALGAELGAAGRAHRRREHDIDVWIRRLERLYVELHPDLPLAGEAGRAGTPRG